MTQQSSIHMVQDAINHLTQEITELQRKRARKNTNIFIYVIAIVVLEMPLLFTVLLRAGFGYFWNVAVQLEGWVGFFMGCALPLWGVYHHVKGALSPLIARKGNDLQNLKLELRRLDQERVDELRRQDDALAIVEKIKLEERRRQEETRAKIKEEEDKRGEQQRIEITRQELTKLTTMLGNESEDKFLESLSTLKNTMRDSPVIFFPQEASELLATIDSRIHLLQVQKIKKTVLLLGMQYSRLQLVEIAEKCHIGDETLILEVVKDMIAKQQIRAEYFTSTKSIAFNQQANIQEKDKFAADLERAFALWGKDLKKD